MQADDPWADLRGETSGAAKRVPGFVAVAEIERFRELRPRIGYTLANALVQALAERIEAGLAGCHVGRVGRRSVEFAFAARDADAATAMLEALAALLVAPFALDDFSCDLSITIGAVALNGARLNDEQVDAAGNALATARAARRKVHVATGEVQVVDSFDQLTLMRDLKPALVRDEAALHYQPKLKSRTETVESVEALLRWVHPTLGPVRTDKLIELAEATGAIRELTHWAIDRAIADRATLAAAGHPLVVFVNISGVLVADAAFARWALARLADADGTIGFEITETAVISDPTAALDHLERFAAAGIRIAIDDYGSGLSSLAYLKQLPAHELKIDRMFVHGLTESHRDPLLVRSSIDLAHALEMEVTAEGVDDPLSMSLLRVMGCDMIQGYQVSPALPVSDLIIFLDEKRHQTGLADRAPSFASWRAAEQG